MKINNYDVDVYLKGIEVAAEDCTVNRAGSARLAGKRPSVEKRHVKSPQKVKRALKEINSNTGVNLYEDAKKRWADCMDKPMTYYRGYSKTGAQVFEEVDKIAKAFDVMGLKQGDQIVACMSNVPEVLTLLLAASKCGLIVNFIGHDFDKNYICEIFKKTPERKLFIGTDDKYAKIAELVEEADFKDKVIVSLTDSLENGVDPYARFDDRIYKFVNRVPEFKKADRDIMSYSEFLDISEKWDSADNGFAKRQFYGPENTLNMPLTITYTSGSTKAGWPKQVVHSNKSYISIARFHDPDLSRMPAMRNMRGLAHIPTHSNTNLTSCITDVISQKCTVAFEPIYHPRFLLYSMVINQPGFVAATRSFLVETAKQMERNPEVAKYAFAKVVNIVAVGEGTSKGEEKFINKSMKKANAGSEALPAILVPTVLSVGGGDCEHGGLFFTLFKSLREKIALNKTVREDYGLTPFQLADLAVLNEDGEECSYEEYGRLVANSNCTMLGYLSDNDNKKFMLMDSDGRVWGDCKAWASVLKNGNVLIKGRYDAVAELSNGQKIPHFMIADKLMEQDGLMSCEVVKPKDHEEALVAHIEFDPEEAKVGAEWLEVLLGEVEHNCQESFAPELAERIVYKIRPYENSFPLTKSGKRSVGALEAEGIADCYKPDVFDCEVVMVPAEDYFSGSKERPVEKVKNN